jgi:tRNA threonylcarbamoyladenosine biosynthesis protein TsaE
MDILVESVKLADLDRFAKRILPLIKLARVVAFMGPLGSGKTTFIRALARQLGVTVPITSPTFTYLGVYPIPGEQQLFHFDLYRITSAAQFYAAGFNEYLGQPNSYVFIEWPELVRSVLPVNALLVYLEYHEKDPEQRLIKILSSNVGG